MRKKWRQGCSDIGWLKKANWGLTEKAGVHFLLPRWHTLWCLSCNSNMLWFSLKQHSLDKLSNLITSMEYGKSSNFRRRVQFLSETMQVIASHGAVAWVWSELGAAMGKSCVEGQQKPLDSDTVALNWRALSLQDVRRPIARRSARTALGLTFSIFVLRGLCHFAYWLGNLFSVVWEFFLVACFST